MTVPPFLCLDGEVKTHLTATIYCDNLSEQRNKLWFFIQNIYFVLVIF